MYTRKEMKANARKVLKRHYGLFLALCMAASLLGGEIALSGIVLEEDGESRSNINFSESIVRSFVELTSDLAQEQREIRERQINETENRYIEESEKNKDAVFGRSRGVFALIANKLGSGAYLMTLALGIRSIVGTDQGAVAVMLVGAMLFLFSVEILVRGVYRTAVLRLFLEGRCYEKVPVQRIWFLLRVKRWCHVGMVNFVTGLFSFLWNLTIVGGVIKYYSYYLVPCIMAENPDIRTLDAITLSRRMMKGHKWECFVLELSFLGWEVLGILTAGLSNFFFNTPYKAAVMAEYYANLRCLAQEAQIENSFLLHDRYLFEKAGKGVLDRAYGDVEEAYEQAARESFALKGVDKFLADVFGLTIRRRKETDRLEEEQSRTFALEYDKRAAEGRIYPTRLYPLPEKRKRKWVVSLNYLRFYSVSSLVMMFFTLSFGGWIWEVSLHLITDGEFVNRGVLHGPWLPIYGSGSVLILLLLNAFRRKPALELILTVVLCGCVEYFTSLYLEIAHGGTRWWDYTGYFLNLHGRICAEGLLVFGIGGMAIVYVLAPFLDGVFRKLPGRVVTLLTAVLILVFAADQIYSAGHPNQGRGITDYGEVSAPW